MINASQELIQKAPLQKTYFILKNGVKVDMMQRSKVRGKCVSDSFDIFGRNKSLREVELTIHSSVKKKVSPEELGVSYFNQLVSDSRNNLRDYSLTSPKFTKTESKDIVKFRASSRDQRLQSFIERSSSNRSFQNTASNIDFEGELKRSQSLLRNNYKLDQDLNADKNKLTVLQRLKESNIQMQKSERKIGPSPNPYKGIKNLN